MNEALWCYEWDGWARYRAHTVKKESHGPHHHRYNKGVECPRSNDWNDGRSELGHFLHGLGARYTRVDDVLGYWTVFNRYDYDDDDHNDDTGFTYSGQERLLVAFETAIKCALATNAPPGGLTSTPIVTLLSKLVDKEEMGAVMAMCSGWASFAKLSLQLPIG